MHLGPALQALPARVQADGRLRELVVDRRNLTAPNARKHAWHSVERWLRMYNRRPLSTRSSEY